MRNIIPHNTSVSNEEVMSIELKNQFLALQHLHSEQSQRSLHQNTPTGSSTSLSSLSASNHESMEDEDNSESTLISTTSSENIMLDLAVSTAMKAQHEIDTLMRGIAELERIMMYQTEDSKNNHAAHNNSQLGTTNKTASVMNFIEQEEYD